jgi:hypothetical protein
MTTVPPVTTGRGAFSAIGKDNGKRYYQYVEGAPLDGNQPKRDVNYRAVNLAVKAIQSRINAYGYSPALVADGIFGKKSDAGVKWVQQRLGLVADGVVGPATCKALWKDLILWFAGVHSVPAAHIYGFMMLESGGDPGAVGSTTPSDQGLNQINLAVHTHITPEQAFDPVFSIDYTAKRLRDARAKYSGKGVDLQTKCSIAQHNAPARANEWYATGEPPNEQIKRYVDLVLTQAAQFKV